MTEAQNLKRHLSLFAIWLLGFCLLVLQFSSHQSLTLPIPKLLTVCLVAAPVLFLLSKNHNKSTTLFFILLFSISLRLVGPLADGDSAFVVFVDPIYNFQLTEIYREQVGWVWGLETGSAFNQLFTPALHLLSAIISETLGLELYTLCRLLPPLAFTLVTILLLFSTFKRLIGAHNAMLASFVFVICYKYNTFNSLYLPESLGTVFFAMALYALVSMKDRKASSMKAYVAVYFVASLSIVLTHFLSSFVFLAVITMALVMNKTMKSLFSTKHSVSATDLTFFATLFFVWAIFVAVVLLVSDINFIRDYLIQLSVMIQRPWETGSIQQPVGILLSPFEMLVAYIGILIPIFLGLLTSLDLFIRKRRKSGYSFYWLRVFAVVVLVLGIVTILGLRAFVKSPDLAYRFVTPLYLFLSPLVAISISIIRSRFEQANPNACHIRTIWQSFKARVLVFVFLIVPVLSTGLLIPNFLGGTVVVADKEVVATSSWLLSYSNRSLAIAGENSLAEPVAAYSRMDFWEESKRARLNNQTITDVIYYGGNMSDLIDFLQKNKGKILFIVNKHFVDHEHFRLRIGTYTRIPLTDATNSAFQAINQLPFLNKIYEGETPTVYIVAKGE